MNILAVRGQDMKIETSISSAIGTKWDTWELILGNDHLRIGFFCVCYLHT